MVVLTGSWFKATLAVIALLAFHGRLLANDGASAEEMPVRLPPAGDTRTSVDIATYTEPIENEANEVVPAVFQPGNFFSGSLRLNQGGRLPFLSNDAPIIQQNNFVDPPAFDGGAIIEGSNVSMKIGGYVKADLIHDFNAIGSEDSFVTSTIPTDAAPRQNTRFHARQTRLTLDARWQIGSRIVRTFVSGDFFGQNLQGGDSLRLRQAFGSIGRFTAGQTWTTFTDPNAVPQTLDFEGSTSNVNRRQGLVRFTQPLGDTGFTLAASLEDPQIIVEVPSQIEGEGRTESPDLVSHLRFERDWGMAQAAFVIRELGFQPVGQPVISETAWGWNFVGAFQLIEPTQAYYQITFGDGIASYRGSPDIVATGPFSAEISSLFGWMIGLHHDWSNSLTSNFTFSRLNLADIPGQDPSNLSRTDYLAVNLIANPYERVFVGIEYLWGLREDVDGATGVANRIQASFGFFLP